MKSIEDYPPVMTPSELADFLQISEPTAYNYMRMYGWEIKIGEGKRGTVRCFRDDVIQWMKDRKRKPA